VYNYSFAEECVLVWKKVSKNEEGYEDDIGKVEGSLEEAWQSKISLMMTLKFHTTHCHIDCI
jgi:hypothetical protein